MKKINIGARIIQRLISKFDLEMGGESSLNLEERVLPITNIDDLLRTPKFASFGNTSRTSASGVGFSTDVIIPTGKRVRIYAFDITRSSGDGTISQIQITGDSQVVVKVQTAASNFRTEILYQPVILDVGQSIALYVAAITTDSVWNVKAYYLEEDAY